MKLTDTQHAILAAAAQHPEHLTYPPERLPAAARQTVAKALLKGDLVIAVHRPAYDAHALWTVDGDTVLLKITDAGLRAIGIDPSDSTAADDATQHHRPEPGEAAPTGGEDPAPRGEDALMPEAAGAAPTRAPRASLRDAAAALLAAWDGVAERGFDGLRPEGQDDGMAAAVAQLRAAVGTKPARAPREPGAGRKPREGTKQEQVLAMLRRPEGATVAQIAEATGWAPHTVRGFFAGLKKRQGIAVEVLERVRQVGPNKEGARGSYTVYHIAG
ncbi:DUF3489 domain-containing protein [Siccirubricoccus phaeus]|uniref:DUF3489 domain-containing protein n=1 Tax=Siccirubricoccus phaeus TaxID=2595053 RepID=UPI001F414019|nr:DUF3489 domain-containing protein [Siccirubricoccus phaeus]